MKTSQRDKRGETSLIIRAAKEEETTRDSEKNTRANTKEIENTRVNSKEEERLEVENMPIKVLKTRHLKSTLKTSLLSLNWVDHESRKSIHAL